MRKWIAVFLLLVSALLLMFYLRANTPVTLYQQIQITANAKAFARVFVETSQWHRWWPTEHGGHMASPLQFTYNKASYRLVEKRTSSLVFSIREGNDSMLTALFIAPLRQDTVVLSWQGINDSSLAKQQAPSKWVDKTNKDLHAVLQRIKSFYGDEKNLYACPVVEAKVTDSLLISFSDTLQNYPAPALYYQWIDRLEKYATAHGAKKAGAPMLNVRTLTGGRYSARVALPVDKALPGEGKVEFMAMLGGGKLLTAEVAGGPAIIEQAFDEMENYMNDHNSVSPAIPFQSLVTDRSREPDTAKWMTKLCWPVM